MCFERSRSTLLDVPEGQRGMGTPGGGVPRANCAACLYSGRPATNRTCIGTRQRLRRQTAGGGANRPPASVSLPICQDRQHYSRSRVPLIGLARLQRALRVQTLFDPIRETKLGDTETGAMATWPTLREAKAGVLAKGRQTRPGGAGNGATCAQDVGCTHSPRGG